MSKDQDYISFLQDKLREVYDYFEPLLNSYGKVIIAGGAVRDSLLGIEPKDYDVFIFNKKYKNQSEKGNTENEIRNLCQKHKQYLELKTSTGSEKFACQNLMFDGLNVQLILNGSATPKELFQGFDLNVCCVGYGYDDEANEVGHIFGKDFPNLSDLYAKKASLLVVNLTDPYVTVQRYCYLATKLGLHCLNSEINKIARKIAIDQNWANEETKSVYKKAMESIFGKKVQKVEVSWSDFGS